MVSEIKYIEASKKEIRLKVLYWRLADVYGAGADPSRVFCLFCSPGPLNKCEGQDLEFKLVDEKGEAVFSGKALVESMDLAPWHDETIGMLTGILQGSATIENVK